MKRLSLRVKLILVMLASALPATLVAVGALYFAQTLAFNEKKNRLVELGSWIVEYQERDLASFTGIRDLLVGHPLEPLRHPQLCRSLLQGAGAYSNRRFSFYVFNEEGFVLCSAGNRISQHLMQRLKAMQDAGPATQLQQENVEIFMDDAGSVYHSRVTFGGTNYVLFGVLERPRPIYSPEMAQFARSAKVLLYDPKALAEKSFTVEEVGWLPAKTALADIADETPALLAAFNGENYLYYKHPSADGQIVTLVGARFSDLETGLTNLVLAALLAPFVFLALMLVLGWLAVHHLVLRWIARLERVTRDYGRGNSNARVDFPENVPHELASLGQAFNKMADNVTRRTNETRLALAGRAAILNDFHHHVKNNFQVIASLMTLEARHRDPDMALMLQHQHDRVQAIAAAYKAAFAQGEGANVSLNSLFDDISRLLRYSFKMNNRQCLVIPLFHDVEVALERAVPLALLVIDLVWQNFSGFRPGEDADPATPILEIELSSLDEQVQVALRHHHGELQTPDDFGVTMMQGYLTQIDATSTRRELDEDGSEILISFEKG